MSTPQTRLPAILREGYARFRSDRYPRHLQTYRALEEGQEPPVMVISCCDSRVDPAAIFDAAPGQLFVVRNVANLVPPYEPAGNNHGTSAAIEFAITALGVSNLVVMGHGRCGGIRAFIEGRFAEPGKPTFIGRWISIVRGAHTYLPADAPKEGPGLQTAFEYASILNSLDNLLTFPFVREAINDSRLKLHGAHFSIAEGLLTVLDPETGEATELEYAGGQTMAAVRNPG